MFIHSSPPDTSTNRVGPPPTPWTCSFWGCSDSMWITIPCLVCAWPWSECPRPLAATVSCEWGPIVHMCRITEAMSLTDLGCKTAKGSSWYRFPKSLEAGWTCSNSKWPTRGRAFNEEMLLEKQQANLKAMQLSSSKMVKLLTIIMFLFLRKHACRYFIWPSWFLIGRRVLKQKVEKLMRFWMAEATNIFWLWESGWGLGCLQWVIYIALEAIKEKVPSWREKVTRKKEISRIFFF